MQIEMFRLVLSRLRLHGPGLCVLNPVIPDLPGLLALAKTFSHKKKDAFAYTQNPCAATPDTRIWAKLLYRHATETRNLRQTF